MIGHKKIGKNRSHVFSGWRSATSATPLFFLAALHLARFFSGCPAPSQIFFWLPTKLFHAHTRPQKPNCFWLLCSQPDFFWLLRSQPEFFWLLRRQPDFFLAAAQPARFFLAGLWPASCFLAGLRPASCFLAASQPVSSFLAGREKKKPKYPF